MRVWRKNAELDNGIFEPEGVLNGRVGLYRGSPMPDVRFWYARSHWPTIEHEAGFVICRSLRFAEAVDAVTPWASANRFRMDPEPSHYNLDLNDAFNTRIEFQPLPPIHVHVAQTRYELAREPTRLDCTITWIRGYPVPTNGEMVRLWNERSFIECFVTNVHIHHGDPSMGDGITRINYDLQLVREGASPNFLNDWINGVRRQ